MIHFGRTVLAGIITAVIVACPSVGIAEPTEAGTRSAAIVRDLKGWATVTSADGAVIQTLRAGDLISGDEQLQLGDGALAEIAFFGVGTVLLTDACELTVGAGGASLTLDVGNLTVWTYSDSELVVEIGRHSIGILPDSFVDVSRSAPGRRELIVHTGSASLDRRVGRITLGSSMTASSYRSGWPWIVANRVIADNLRGPAGSDNDSWFMFSKRRLGWERWDCRAVWDSTRGDQAWAYCAAMMDPCYCEYLLQPSRKYVIPTNTLVPQTATSDSDDNPGIDDSREPSDGPRDGVGDPPGVVVVRASDDSGIPPASTRSFSSLREPEYNMSWSRPSPPMSSSTFGAYPSHSSCSSRDAIAMPKRRPSTSSSSSSRKKSD